MVWYAFAQETASSRDTHNVISLIIPDSKIINRSKDISIVSGVFQSHEISHVIH